MALGFVLLFSPIPVGVFFMAIGLSLLISVSDAVAHKVLVYRKKHGKLNDQLNWVEGKLGSRLHFVSAAMHKTRPSSSQGERARDGHESLDRF